MKSPIFITKCSKPPLQKGNANCRPELDDPRGSPSENGPGAYSSRPVLRGTVFSPISWAFAFGSAALMHPKASPRSVRCQEARRHLAGNRAGLSRLSVDARACCREAESTPRLLALVPVGIVSAMSAARFASRSSSFSTAAVAAVVGLIRLVLVDSYSARIS